MATALSASSLLLFFPSVRKAERVKPERECTSETKVCPSTLHSLSPSLPLCTPCVAVQPPCTRHQPSSSRRRPSSSPTNQPASQPAKPSSLSPSTEGCRPSRRHRPRQPSPTSRYSRIPVSPPPSPLHRRRINTGRHPNSLEVNASFPRAATTSTSYQPYNLLPRRERERERERGREERRRKDRLASSFSLLFLHFLLNFLLFLVPHVFSSFVPAFRHPTVCTLALLSPPGSLFLLLSRCRGPYFRWQRRGESFGTAWVRFSWILKEEKEEEEV